MPIVIYPAMVHFLNLSNCLLNIVEPVQQRGRKSRVVLLCSVLYSHVVLQVRWISIAALGGAAGF